jgi:hypothetical protein
MLAYIFWHRPYPNIERQRYEQAIVHFQNDLAGSKPPGFIGATSFRIEAVPWLSDLPGYEDWYLLDGTWAMDPLNAFAISGHVQAPHDGVAAMMEQGHGGLYADAGGEIVSAPRSTMHWLTRPRGIQWQPAIEAVRGACPREGLAATDGFGAGGRVCRRNSGRSRDRRASRLAASPRDANAPASRTCVSLRKFPSTCSRGRRRTPLSPCTSRSVMLRGSPRLAKTH